MIRRGIIVSTFTLGLLGAFPLPALAHAYSYTIEKRGEIESSMEVFGDIARQTLSDIRGWTLNLNVDFRRVSSDEDFRLILASPREVDRAASACSAQWSCRVGDQILINDERWRNTTSTWPESRRAYRSYVINHELGHWLGIRDIRECPRGGHDAPVMMQQSKGLDGCNARVWPKFWERRRIAEIRDVDGWPVPPKDAPCTIEGSADDDSLDGTGHADVICGGTGNDKIRSFKGFDVVRAGAGDDTIGTGSQADIALGGDGNDKIIGWAGSDELRGQEGNDLIRGKGHDDLLGGGAGVDRLHAGWGDDVLRGWTGNDVMVGWAGDDHLIGHWGQDEMRGKLGRDEVRGYPGNDLVGGGSEDDRLFGGADDDVLKGWAGDDLLDGRGGSDHCDGGSGSDELVRCN